MDCFNNIPGFEVILPLSHSFRNWKSIVSFKSNLCKFGGSRNTVNWRTGLILPLGINRNNPRPYCCSKICKRCVAQACCPSFHHCSWEGGQPHVCAGRRVATFLLPSNIPQEFLGVLWKEENQLLLQQAVTLGEVPEIWGVAFISIAWLWLLKPSLCWKFVLLWWHFKFEISDFIQNSLHPSHFTHF